MEHFVPGSRAVALCEFIDSLGGSPGEALALAGLGPATIVSPGSLIPAGNFFDLFQAAAEVTGHRDFGLRWGSRTHFSVMGPLSTYMRHCATVRQAGMESSTFMMAQNWGLAVRVIEMGARGRCDIQVTARGRHAPLQFTESFITIAQQLPRAMLGEDWRPKEIWFVHQPMSPVERYGDIFGCPVRFGMMSNAIVVDAADMDRAPLAADERVKSLVGNMLRESERHEEWNHVMSYKAQVRGMLQTRDVSLNSLAARLGVKPSVLQRRLENVGICFRELVTRVRLEILSEGQVEPGAERELMHLLGFDKPNVMKRFLNQHADDIAASGGGARSGQNRKHDA